jgi:hypothetical protein
VCTGNKNSKPIEISSLLENILLKQKADFFLVQSFKIHFLLAWYDAAKINHTRKVTSCWHA